MLNPSLVQLSAVCLKTGLIVIADPQQTCSKHLERGWKKKNKNNHTPKPTWFLLCQCFEALQPNKDWKVMLALASSCWELGVFVCICPFISQQRDSDGRQTRVGLSPKMTLVVLLVTCTSKVLKKSIQQCFLEKPNREREMSETCRQWI